MENASKALIMAAEILLGVMIISVGVYLFNTLGNYSAETTKKIEEAQIDQFNNQFLKYYNKKCTIHDIVDLANLARKINEENGFSTAQTVTDYENYPNIYVQIDLGKDKKNLESWRQDKLITLIKENDIIEDVSEYPVIKYFYCKDQPGISNITKRVNYMKFVEI